MWRYRILSCGTRYTCMMIPILSSMNHGNTQFPWLLVKKAHDKMVTMGIIEKADELNRQDVLTCPHLESEWQPLSVSQSKGPKCSSLSRPLPYAISRWGCTWACRFTLFPTVDLKFGYWVIVLDYKSSIHTTFNSPFRCYTFLWLAFGLVCSQDVLKHRMDLTL